MRYFLSLQVSPPHPAPPTLRLVGGVSSARQAGRARPQSPTGRCETTATRALGSALPPSPPGPGVPLLVRGEQRAGAGPGEGAVGGGTGNLPRSPPRRRTRARPARGRLCRGPCGSGRAMEGKSLSVLRLGVLLLAAASGDAEPPPSCEGVRKVFQLRQLGPLRGIPESPRAGEGKLGGGRGLPSLCAGTAGLNFVPLAVISGWCRRRGCSSAGHLSPAARVLAAGPGSIATSGVDGVVVVEGRMSGSLLGVWALQKLEHPDTCLKSPGSHFHAVPGTAQRRKPV